MWLLASTTLLTATLIRVHGGAQPPGAIVRYAGLLLAQATPFMLIIFLLVPRISGPVFEAYDGQTWRARVRDPQRPGRPPVIEAGARKISYITTPEAHKQRWLLALDLPLVLPDDSGLSPTLTPTLETLAREPVLEPGATAGVTPTRSSRGDVQRLCQTQKLSEDRFVPSMMHTAESSVAYPSCSALSLSGFQSRLKFPTDCLAIRRSMRTAGRKQSSSNHSQNETSKRCCLEVIGVTARQEKCYIQP